jgi:hypothetical protein
MRQRVNEMTEAAKVWRIAARKVRDRENGKVVNMLPNESLGVKNGKIRPFRA